MEILILVIICLALLTCGLIIFYQMKVNRLEYDNDRLNEFLGERMLEKGRER